MRVILNLSFTFNNRDELKHLASSSYEANLDALPPIKSTIRIHGFNHFGGVWDLDGIIENYHALVHEKVNKYSTPCSSLSAEVSVTFATKRV
jgi:hypothetical protein